MTYWLVVWNLFSFPYSLGRRIQTDFPIFQRGISTTRQHMTAGQSSMQIALQRLTGQILLSIQNWRTWPIPSLHHFKSMMNHKGVQLSKASFTYPLVNKHSYWKWQCLDMLSEFSHFYTWWFSIVTLCYMSFPEGSVLQNLTRSQLPCPWPSPPCEVLHKATNSLEKFLNEVRNVAIPIRTIEAGFITSLFVLFWWFKVGWYMWVLPVMPSLQLSSWCCWILEISWISFLHCCFFSFASYPYGLNSKR